MSANALRANGWRSALKPPPLNVRFDAPHGHDVGYDGCDIAELAHLIAATCRVLRANLERQPHHEGPAAVFQAGGGDAVVLLVGQ